MTRKSGDPPEDGSDYEVGYGKPPRHSQFKPGESGNRAGRPPGAKGKHKQLEAFLQPTREVILEELHRMLTISENGKTKKVPAVRVVARAAIKSAATGSTHAQKTMLQYGLDIEREVAAINDRAFELAIEIKEDVGRRRALGQPELQCLPHPDDIYLDWDRRTVEFRGPVNPEQKAALDELVRLRDRYARGFESLCKEAKESSRDLTVPIFASMAQERFDFINDRLPERYRTELEGRMSEAEIVEAKGKFRAASAKKAARRGTARAKRREGPAGSGCPS